MWVLFRNWGLQVDGTSGMVLGFMATHAQYLFSMLLFLDECFYFWMNASISG
jgi:hypothetical protein